MKENHNNLLKRTQNALLDGSAKNPITVTVTSENKERFYTKIKMRNHVIESDQPYGFEGTNKGPKPSELVLAALAACQETTWRIYAESMKIQIDKISVQLTGTQDLRGFMGVDKKVWAGFQSIEGTINIESPSSKEDLQRLQKQVDDHCPVLDDLTRTVPVSLSIVSRPTRQSSDSSK